MQVSMTCQNFVVIPSRGFVVFRGKKLLSDVSQLRIRRNPLPGICCFQGVNQGGEVVTGCRVAS